MNQLLRLAAFLACGATVVSAAATPWGYSDPSQVLGTNIPSSALRYFQSAGSNTVTISLPANCNESSGCSIKVNGDQVVITLG